ncbi:MAG: hypothetical protein ACNS60_13005 [Candidatus Cyclobacteriaceae bacterium M2_1C_046]
MNYSEEQKKNKIRDIEDIDFGDNILEITSSLEILLTLFENDDDPEVIGACKKRLKEGVALLKKYGAADKAKNFKV